MSGSDLLRLVANAGAVALPAVAPATLPWWETPALDLFGANIPILSMALSLVGLGVARGVAAAREGPTPGGHYLTAVLTVILIGIVIDGQPTPGVAAAAGVGIGGSGIVLYDLLRDRILSVFGRSGKKPEGGA